MEFLKHLQKGADAITDIADKAGPKLFENPMSKGTIKGLEALGFKGKTFEENEAPADPNNPKDRIEAAMGISKMQHKVKDKMESPEGRMISDKSKKIDPLGKDGNNLASGLIKGMEKPLDKALKWLDDYSKTPLGKMTGVNPLLTVMGGFLKKTMEGARKGENSEKKGQKPNKEKGPTAGKPTNNKEIDETAKFAKEALGMLMQAGQLALLAIPGVGLLSSALSKGMLAGVKGIATQAATKAPGLMSKGSGIFPDVKKLGGIAKKAAGTAAGKVQEQAKTAEDDSKDSRDAAMSV